LRDFWPVLSSWLQLIALVRFAPPLPKLNLTYVHSIIVVVVVVVVVVVAKVLTQYPCPCPYSLSGEYVLDTCCMAMGVNISIHGEEDREGLEVPPRSLCGVKVKQ
jgi:hypothetical protein